MIDCEKHLHTNEMAENNINDKIECNFILKNGNKFIDNTAEISGGAIAYRSEGYTDADDSSIFINNTAGMHSPHISSFPTKLKVIYDEKMTSYVKLEGDEMELLKKT